MNFFSLWYALVPILTLLRLACGRIGACLHSVDAYGVVRFKADVEMRGTAVSCTD